MSNWPKQIPELSEIEQKTRDEWMKYWHEKLPSKYGLVEKFNQGFPLKNCMIKMGEGVTTLEIGAGLGEHIKYEDLSKQQYHVIELRENMVKVIIDRFPQVDVHIGDIQKKTEYPDEYFDRILAIHVLEHLPDLPNALNEVFRILKKRGIFSVVIPCEGGLAYTFARQISTVRIFNKKFGDRGINYHWLMRKTEHINQPKEIMEELKMVFLIEKDDYFPLKVPLVFCNLCIGLHLRKK